MRSIISASLVGSAFLLAAAPAEAEWHPYVIRGGVSFSFTAPDGLKAENTIYTSATAGQRKAVVFASVEDNVEYKIIVVNFTGGGDESALIKEATTASQDRSKVLMDEDARVDSSYGRKITVDLPNNTGRAMSAIFFKDNHLIQLRATVLPGGDYRSSEIGRFVDSLAFYEMRSEESPTELTLPD